MDKIRTKFINSPENITAELLEGYVLAYPDQVALAAENIVVNADGSVTLKLEEVGVIAFVVDAAEETVAEVTSPV